MRFSKKGRQEAKKQMKLNKLSKKGKRNMYYTLGPMNTFPKVSLLTYSRQSEK